MARPSYRTYGSTTYASGSHDSGASIWDEITAAARKMVRWTWAYSNGRGRHSAWHLAVKGGHQLRRNMVRRRLLSFPHVLVALWLLVLFWGERWTFASKVNRCDWDHWEDWVSQLPSPLGYLVSILLWGIGGGGCHGDNSSDNKLLLNLS